MSAHGNHNAELFTAQRAYTYYPQPSQQRTPAPATASPSRLANAFWTVLGAIAVIFGAISAVVAVIGSIGVWQMVVGGVIGFGACYKLFGVCYRKLKLGV